MINIIINNNDSDEDHDHDPFMAFSVTTLSMTNK